jgi:hypothetical protein
VRPEDLRAEPRSLLRRLISRLSGQESVPLDQEVRRLENKRMALRQASDEWLSLLRDMEQEGQSGEAAYERYYDAYLVAKQHQKDVELKLFNLRSQQAS